MKASDEKYRRKRKLEKNLDSNNSIDENSLQESSDNAVLTNQRRALNSLIENIDSHGLTPSGDSLP